MDRKRKGYALAGLSSATFGLAPLFTLALLDAGLSTCEVLAYRWGVAALVLLLFGALSGAPLRIARGALPTVLLLALLRAATSLSLVVAYRNIASGVASTIHFIYPLAVALAMACLFGEKRQAGVLPAVAASLVGPRCSSRARRRAVAAIRPWGSRPPCCRSFSTGDTSSACARAARCRSPRRR